MRARPKWTDQENEILRKEYTRRNSAKVLHDTLLPNRSAGAIIHQANILGLVTRNGAYHEYDLVGLLANTKSVVHRSDIGACMEWLGDKRPNGYGVATHNNKRISTHRLIMILDGWSIDGRLVCHHCDNRICINPNHLYVGTHIDNNQDTVRRGRYKNQYGALNESR